MPGQRATTDGRTTRPETKLDADDGKAMMADRQITQIASSDGQMTLSDIKSKQDVGQVIQQITEVVEDAAFKEKKAADRKERMRLKERLRNSMRREPQSEEKFSWSDYIFGISAADQRSGKEGSRSFFLSFILELALTRSRSNGFSIPL